MSKYSLANPSIGPWRVLPSDNLVVVDAQLGTVARCATFSSGQYHRDRANACLIAAAPELLAALIEASAILDAHLRDIGIDPGQEMDTPAYRARAAVAKATGGST